MALEFDRASVDYASSTSRVGISGYPFSIAAWVNVVDITVGFQGICSQGNFSVNPSGFWFHATSGDAIETLRLSLNDGTSSADLDSTGKLTAGVWQHACCVATSSDVSFYINGAFDSSPAHSSTWLESTTHDFYIACENDGSNSPNIGAAIDGSIAELAIYDRALTAAEVASLGLGFYPPMVAQDGLLRYWSLRSEPPTELELIGGMDVTVTGATSIDHPRIIYPGAQILQFPGSSMTITDIDTDFTWDDGDQNLVIAGTGFV